ncbi:MAG: enoyl-CoA hydratase/isomerase family protein [Burkholderiaceae bacterium]|nr:enoyl-CoA hydratase/isomerase family protein [Burkholderiaceae bacterium]
MGELQQERLGNVLRVTLDAPPVNALSRALIDELGSVAESVATDPSVSVLHLRSTGRAFCAGANLAEMRVGFSGPEGLEQQLAFVRRLQQVFERIERLDAVSVAEVGGHALGGGLELALACDLRIGAAEARIGLPEVELGLVPGAGGTQRLTRLCGPALARRLILGAEMLEGCAAEQYGLLHWAVPKADLPARAQALVDRLAALPRAALVEAKACIDCATRPGNEGFEHELLSTRRLMNDAETKRRVAAFLAR